MFAMFSGGSKHSVAQDSESQPPTSCSDELAFLKAKPGVCFQQNN